MSNKPTSFFKRPIRSGDPISSVDAGGLSDMAKALENLEVVGRNGIKASIEWANGYPRIVIELETPAT